MPRACNRRGHRVLLEADLRKGAYSDAYVRSDLFKSSSAAPKSNEQVRMIPADQSKGKTHTIFRRDVDEFLAAHLYTTWTEADPKSRKRAKRRRLKRRNIYWSTVSFHSK